MRDVVNEPPDTLSGAFDPNPFFFQTLGPVYVAEAFALARALDPAAEPLRSPRLERGT